MSTDQPHSADVLSDWRDGWWHRDYLELVGRRLGLSRINHAVDVGCGKGHWGRMLRPLLSADATLTGVDRETEWVQAATEVAEARQLDGVRYLQGTAESLPLETASADLVTCQTVLMHVASADVAIAEMVRVLAPGGLLLLAEPSNVANAALTDSVSSTFSAARRGRIVEFEAAMSLGRIALGEGDETIGDRLPMLLNQHGLVDVRVMKNDRINHVAPPYTDAMLAALGPLPDLVRTRGWRFNRDEAWRLYAASGGTADRFETLFGEWIAQVETVVGDIEAGTYWSTMGHQHYLFAARKPLAPPTA